MKAATFAVTALLLAALAAPSVAQEIPRVDPSSPGFRELLPLPAAQADSVRAVLLGYVAAVRQRDGAVATRAVSRATRAYYAQMAELARTAPEAQVRALPLMDRISVLMYRHRIPPAVLRTLTGDSAFAYTVSEGWVAKTMTDDPFPPAMDVYGEGDSAIVPHRGMTVQLVREEGAWRWDMTSIIRSASETFAASIPRGMKEDDFILFVLQYSNGRTPTPTIWKPMP
jgi:hypothetical protein